MLFGWLEWEKEKDSISVEKLNISDTYTVGINLEKAISNPGSDFDLVLREGDVLFIPEYINTVKISGAVMYPNTVLYKRGESLRYYINQAGGYGNLAKKKKSLCSIYERYGIPSEIS